MNQKIEEMKAQIEMKKSKIKIKELEIRRLERKVEELEKDEKSPAEKWANADIAKHKDDYITDITFKDIRIRAHEAGEKYAATATHEIYKPLVETIEAILRGIPGHVRYSRDEIERRMFNALKNLTPIED